jgi:hypothetical protein
MAHSPPASPVESAPPRSPVWTPNPGVPLTARVLAYAFGALLGLAILLSLVIERPPDLPLKPARWATYTTSIGMTLRYPAGWTLRTTGKGRAVTLFFAQLNGSPVTVEVLATELREEVDADAQARIGRIVEDELLRDYPDYTPASAPSGDLHRFTCTTGGTHPLAQTGAWLLRIHGTKVAVFIARTPLAGWPVMEGILTEMAGSVAF